MGVPFIDIKRFEVGFLEEFHSKLIEMTKNAQFIGGSEVADLEKNLSTYNQTKYSISCANGTDAIQLALRAVGIGRGHKVLLPDSTFWATFEAVVNVGADPYVVDTNLSDLQMDFSTFERAFEEIKPNAVILVHLYGWGSQDLQKYREYCNQRNVPLIEDGAQCFGVLYKGEPIYKNALISTTSFYPAKVLGAAGDGGAVFTNNDDLADRTRKLANHGRTSHYGHGMVGWNSRLDSFQGLFLNLSLKYFSKRLESRRSWAKKYRDVLPGFGIQVISPPKDYEENGYCNVTLFPNAERTQMESKLKTASIGYANIYPGAMSDQEGAKDYLKGSFSKGNAKLVSSSVLNFPLFPYMTDSEFQEITQIIQSK
jgi:UDP-2-acetamido-2-deoxy-ribo-hexuluronate aminotransferase